MARTRPRGRKHGRDLRRLIRLLAVPALACVVALARLPVLTADAANSTITITSGSCAGGGFEFCYNPEAASSSTGSQVTWSDQTGVSHTATLCNSSACPGSPASSATCDNFSVSISGSSSGSHTFKNPGTCYYYCVIHGYAALHGTITVAQGSTTTTYQDESPQIAYDTWRAVGDSTASGGTYRTSATKNTNASFTFSGTSITWTTHKGPAQGIASVRIDTTAEPNVDLYASTAQPFSHTYTGLTATTHKIVVTVSGAKNAASSGFGVAVDAFMAGGATTQDTSIKVTYDQWGGAASASASGGTLRLDRAKSATASLHFTGTEIDWITATGPSDGMAAVTIDGVSKGTVDLYASAVHWQVKKAYTGLATGAHTVVITVLGTHNASSTGTNVVVDVFVAHS